MAFKHNLQGEISMKHLYAGASMLALLASAGAAYAADAADAAAASAAPTVSEVIVTGTRQTGVKAIDSAAPIQVVGGEALKNAGHADLIQTLESHLPSLNAQAYGADTAALTLSMALRGLSPNDTLVLVDGKRRHTTTNLSVDAGSPYTGAAATDLNFIPLAAIDHVEVLQDGAAAQYGSDAIAGVINIILKKADHGGSITFGGGQYYEGDGDTGAWSINKGFSLGGGKGFVNVTIEERYHDFSQQGQCDIRLFNLDCTPRADLSAIDQGVVQATHYPKVNRIYGDPQYNIYNVFYNAGYDLGAGVQFYTFGSYGHRNISGFENYRKPSKVIGFDAQGNVTSVPFPTGFSPREAIKEDDYSFTAGLKGEALGWNWDLATTYGDDHDHVSTINSANRDLFLATGATPTQFFDGIFETSEWTTNLDLTRDFKVGLASPLNVAFGGEARRNAFTIKSGDPASYYGAGGQSYPGFQPADAGTHTRTNYSAYIDFAVDPIKNLHLDLAGRYESYSDFGDTEIGKVTARYDFTPQIAIRGTISTGFRAPTLLEEYYSATNVSPAFAQVQLPADSPAAALAGFAPLRPEKTNNYSIGIVAHPVEHLSITVDAYEIDIRDRITNTALTGSTCSLTDPVTGVCVGYVSPTNPGPNYTLVSQGVLDAIAAHGNTLDTGLSFVGINLFANAANTSTKGVEATVNYATDFGDWGHVDWTVGFNYNQTKVTALAPLPPQVINADFGQTVILTPNPLSALTTGAPEMKVVLGAFYSVGRWSVNLRETIYGPASEIQSPDQTGINGTVQHIGTTGITDLNVSYKINSSLRLDVGANNLFDIKPPAVPYIPGSGMSDGNNVYGEPMQFSPYGINGGYWYGKITWAF
jgi:iron complex outermembrane recepter protein